jgi:hypothetical protein
MYSLWFSFPFRCCEIAVTIAHVHPRVQSVWPRKGDRQKSANSPKSEESSEMSIDDRRMECRAPEWTS